MDVPDKLNLEHLRARGPQPGEALQPDAPAAEAPDGAAGAGAPSQAAPASPLQPDPETVAALVGMGFSENGSKRATLATQVCSWRWLLGSGSGQRCQLQRRPMGRRARADLFRQYRRGWSPTDTLAALVGVDFLDAWIQSVKFGCAYRIGQIAQSGQQGQQCAISPRTCC